MPAFTLLFTWSLSFLLLFLVDDFDGVGDGDDGRGGVSGCEGAGVKGVEKGWAAEVEVAGGGVGGRRRRVLVVIEARRVRGENGERRRRQRWQIIVVEKVVDRGS